MKLNLEKGQKLNLEKVGLAAEDGALQDIYMGAGWDVNEKASDDFDLDIFAIMMSAGKVVHVGYFGDKAPCPGIQLSEDNTTGEGDGDDEFINITAADLPADIDVIYAGINIYQGEAKGQNFGMVDEAYMRMLPADDVDNEDKEIFFDLQFDADKATGIKFGKFTKRRGAWYFAAEGDTFEGSIQDLVDSLNA